MSIRGDKAIVKQVLSGDTIVLRGKPVNGPPQEKTVSLANLVVPRLARRSNDANAAASEPEEAFAWDAREFLRTRLVGREVTFKTEYTIATMQRDFVSIIVNGENISQLLVKAGLAKTRTPTNASKISEELVELQRIEAEAQAAGTGQWSTKEGEAAKHSRQVVWKVENSKALLEAHQGKQVDAIIEQLRDASTVRVLLLPSHTHATIQLSGVKAPGFKRAEGSDKEEAEPFAEEARFFVECRLLQKDVKVVLEAVAPQPNTFVGSIIHPAGNIAEALLSEGLAKCNDKSIGLVSVGREKYRAAEKSAKDKKVRLWKNFVASAASSSGPVDTIGSERTGVVVEIVNAETIIVKAEDGVHRLNLSSIRQQKPNLKAASSDAAEGAEGAEPKKQATPAAKLTMYDIPCGFEAREFLRKRLIGHRVKFTVDYIKAASEGFPSRTFATVVLDNTNIAEALVSQGFVTVVRTRNDDDVRSPIYDDLLAAEARAEKAAKGIHNKKDAHTLRVTDITADAIKAKQFLPSLQRAGRTTVVVEYIMSGSRVKVYLPREKGTATFMLSGISCPRASRGATEPGQPFGDEALALVRERTLQHDVDILVEGIDKSGGLIGALYLPNNDNLAAVLVDRGLATVHSSAEKLNYARDLINAEQRAKTARLNLWKDFKEEVKPTAAELAAAEEVVERKVEYSTVVVTEVTTAVNLWVQKESDLARLDTLMEGLAKSFESNPPVTGAYKPKLGDLCGAKYSADGNWYRAKVTKVTGNQIGVLFVDYGNSETTTPANLASLPAAFSAAAPAAQEVFVAFAALPSDPEWANAAVEFVRECVLDKQLRMNIEYKREGRAYVSLLDPETKDDLAGILLEEGLALVEPRRERALAALVAEATKAQDAAKRAHRGIWRHGDASVEEAREFGFTGKAR
ncbi:hypothetical protein CAOG_04649 [Capsaspora owczarzaki ATCC 30864]|uniref:Staphylococcal nuclease domain-containing protein 1 n=1 Tax=Capsaspora owczarzaki (strain ATCC 30864) TaxID=595528 RepID=A0A0D2WQH8_CAPO3|nr:hypothetical protein CAOG_04649 [Capsaspora owczarzaki ATCC 30864]KJE93940.1 hypothetical protein CAOG_004649 [Capsaspora owczarzaki ATCC 30864]|eukprot:XP_004347396.1 hypothetical protein CAOG_04649 [Capsaspora owczarzaki ATCC 30864]